MSVISEENLAKLYQEIDFERDKSRHFIAKVEKINRSLKIFKIVSIALFLTAVYFGYTIYFVEEIKQEEIVVNSKVNEKETNIQEALKPYEVHTVQIGILENKKIPLLSDGFINLRIFPTKKGDIYSLGNYKTRKEAEKLRKELIKIGFKGAWITSYKQGKRIPPVK